MENAPWQSQTKRFPRVSVDFPVIVLFEEKRFRCQALQLSEFGIFLAPTYRDLVGKSVRIKLILESPIPSLFLSAIVAYATIDGLGIRFKKISLDQQLSLRSYVHASGIGLLKEYCQVK